MKVSNNGLELIKRFEGCRLKAYQDSVGVWTIGYGWTQPVDGRSVAGGMTITQDKAEEVLLKGVVQFEQGVSKLLTVTVNQNQFDALVSFAYNLGLKALAGSTLLKMVNEGNFKAAADQFTRWVFSGDKYLPGLYNRRTAERELFLCTT